MLDFLNDKAALEQTYWIIGCRTKPFFYSKNQTNY